MVAGGGVGVAVAVGLGWEEVVAGVMMLSVDDEGVANVGSDEIASVATTLLAGGEVNVGVGAVVVMTNSSPEISVEEGEGHSLSDISVLSTSIHADDDDSRGDLVDERKDCDKTIPIEAEDGAGVTWTASTDSVGARLDQTSAADDEDPKTDSTSHDRDEPACRAASPVSETTESLNGVSH